MFDETCLLFQKGKSHFSAAGRPLGSAKRDGVEGDAWGEKGVVKSRRAH